MFLWRTSLSKVCGALQVDEMRTMFMVFSNGTSRSDPRLRQSLPTPDRHDDCFVSGRFYGEGSVSTAPVNAQIRCKLLDDYKAFSADRIIGKVISNKVFGVHSWSSRGHWPGFFMGSDRRGLWRRRGGFTHLSVLIYPYAETLPLAPSSEQQLKGLSMGAYMPDPNNAVT